MNRENLIYNLWYRQPDWYSWSKAFLLSLFLHLGILLVALTFTTTSTGIALQPVIYNVELVSVPEKPRSHISAAAGTKVSTLAKSAANRKSATTIPKSIPIWRVRTKSVAINTPMKKASVSPPGVEPTDGAPEVGKELEKLTKLKAAENKSPASKKNSIKTGENARSGAAPVQGAPGKPAGERSVSGEALSLARSTYYAEVWDRIRKEWALPDELVSHKGNLGATIIIRIRRDGKILEARFEKRSGDKFFDESVWRAVWKADPLPPFPEIYSAKTDELGIRFSLVELLNSRQ